jgi:MFS family permease
MQFLLSWRRYDKRGRDVCGSHTGMSKQSSSVSFSAILTLSILSAIYFIENYDRSLISVSPIPYIDYSSYEYSLLSGTLFALVYTLSGLFFSITNIFNQYRVYSIAFASFIFSLVIFLVPFAKTFYQQALIRIVMGLAQSVITPFSSGIISSHFHEKYRGIAFSIFNFGAYLSFALALSLGTFIYDTFGWKAGYYLFGLFGIFLSILTTFLAKENPYADEMEPLRSLSIPEPIANAIPSSSDRKGLSNSADSSPSSNTIGASCSSTLQEMMDLFGRVLSLWRSNPSLYLLCLATGVRIGAGYVWTAYTSVFFSELYLTNPDDDNDKCLYSYNRTYTSPSLPTTEHFYSSSTVCDADYPYCFPSSGSLHTHLLMAPYSALLTLHRRVPGDQLPPLAQRRHLPPKARELHVLDSSRRLWLGQHAWGTSI